MFVLLLSTVLRQNDFLLRCVIQATQLYMFQLSYLLGIETLAGVIPFQPQAFPAFKPETYQMLQLCVAWRFRLSMEYSM